MANPTEIFGSSIAESNTKKAVKMANYTLCFITHIHFFTSFHELIITSFYVFLFRDAHSSGILVVFTPLLKTNYQPLPVEPFCSNEISQKGKYCYHQRYHNVS